MQLVVGEDLIKPFTLKQIINVFSCIFIQIVLHAVE